MKKYQYDLNSLEKHGKSFYWASFFLPRQNKLGASRLYSICRYFDDLADETDKNLAKEIKNEFYEISSNKSHDINKFFQNYGISLSILEDLTNGLIKDQTNVRIDTEAELIEYSYEVAGTVGLMMMPIIFVNNQNARKHAIDLGIAMQLTNIARDVYEDANMNRIYLPKEWTGFTTVENLKATQSVETQKRVKTALKKIIELSDTYYKNGFSGLKYIPLRSRFAIFVAAQVYKGIGEKIKRKDFHYSSKRTFLSNYNKIIITLTAIIKFFFINSIYKNYSPIRKKFRNENL